MLRPKGGGLKALADMPAKKVFFLTAPLIRLKTNCCFCPLYPTGDQAVLRHIINIPLLANTEHMPVEFNPHERKKYINGWLTKQLSSAVKDTLYTLFVKVRVCTEEFMSFFFI